MFNTTPFIKSPQVYLEEETMSIIYFTFDAPVVEKIIGLTDPKPEYSQYRVPGEKFWKRAQFQDNLTFTAAALALRLTFK